MLGFVKTKRIQLLLDHVQQVVCTNTNRVTHVAGICDPSIRVFNF